MVHLSYNHDAFLTNSMPCHMHFTIVVIFKAIFKIMKLSFLPLFCWGITKQVTTWYRAYLNWLMIFTYIGDKYSINLLVQSSWKFMPQWQVEFCTKNGSNFGMTPPNAQVASFDSIFILDDVSMYCLFYHSHKSHQRSNLWWNYIKKCMSLGTL